MGVMHQTNVDNLFRIKAALEERESIHSFVSPLGHVMDPGLLNLVLSHFNREVEHASLVVFKKKEEKSSDALRIDLLLERIWFYPISIDALANIVLDDVIKKYGFYSLSHQDAVNEVSNYTGILAANALRLIVSDLKLKNPDFLLTTFDNIVYRVRLAIESYKDDLGFAQDHFCLSNKNDEGLFDVALVPLLITSFVSASFGGDGEGTSGSNLISHSIINVKKLGVASNDNVVIPFDLMALENDGMLKKRIVNKKFLY